MMEYEVIKHCVCFMSPGTIVAETTSKIIKKWDITQAVEMAKDIKERHGAIPYGFYFKTKGRKEGELDSKVIAESGMYYLGGEVKTLSQIQAENDPENKILISNMECNGYERIVINNNSYTWTQPLKEDDKVLDIAI